MCIIFDSIQESGFSYLSENICMYEWLLMITFISELHLSVIMLNKITIFQTIIFRTMRFENFVCLTNTKEGWIFHAMPMPSKE